MNGRLPQRYPSAWLVCAFTALVLWGLPAQAQPSGGPYGPLQQNYEVPAQANHVYYVAPDGKEDAAGTSLQQPTTLEAAIAKVVTGDAIILRGGIYRTGGLRFNQGITMQPYAGEHPVLKGTRVATEWRALPNNVWRTSWKTLFPAAPLGWWQRDREGMRTPLHRFNNDMVFVDGEMLQVRRLGGRARQPLVLHRLREGTGLPRRRSRRTGSSRSRPLTAPWSARPRPSTARPTTTRDR